MATNKQIKAVQAAAEDFGGVVSRRCAIQIIEAYEAAREAPKPGGHACPSMAGPNHMLASPTPHADLAAELLDTWLHGPKDRTAAWLAVAKRAHELLANGEPEPDMSAGEESEMSEPFPEYWAAKRREVITHLRERAKMLDDPCDDPVDRRTDASIETGLAADDLEQLARLRSHPDAEDFVDIFERDGYADDDCGRLLLQLLRGDTGQGG